MEITNQLMTEQTIRQLAYCAVVTIVGISLLLMLSSWLAAGIMPRGHAVILASKTNDVKGAQR